MFNLKQRLASNRGYTIDQTILIVAIIAILITMIIVTIGWQLISRSSGTKLGAQLRQIEDANGQFYSVQHMWPHQAYSSPTADNNMAVLVNRIATSSWNTAVNQGALTNLLPGMGYDTTAGAVQHSFGSGGGTVAQQVNVASNWGLGTGRYLVVRLTHVPLAEAAEADSAIDGEDTPGSGRLVYGTNDCLNATAGGTAPSMPSTAPTTGAAYLCYAANTVQ